MELIRKTSKKYYCKSENCNNFICLETFKYGGGLCKPCSSKLMWREHKTFKEKIKNSYIKIECNNCGIIFKCRKFSNQMFCSIRCATISKNKNRKGFKDIKVICSNCEVEFTLLSCEFDKHINKEFKNFYCSKQCSDKGSINSIRLNTSKSLVKFYEKSDVKHRKYRNAGFREDIGVYVRSGWEANYIRVLNFLNIKWEYEPKIFKFEINNKTTTYRPDFYLPNENLWIEVKGFWYDALSKLKYEEFSKIYNIKLINSEKYKQMALKYQDKLPNWEGRKYADPYCR